MTKKRKIHLIDPTAFVVALIGAPLLATAASFFLIIPVFALLVGALPYLFLGTPVLLWHLGRNAPDSGKTALLALKTVCVAVLPFWLIVAIFSGPAAPDIEMFAILSLLSLLFAAIWGSVFGLIYLALQRDFYKQTL